MNQAPGVSVGSVPGTVGPNDGDELCGRRAGTGV